MIRSLRSAVVALGAVAVMGSTTTAQAAVLPSADTLSYAYTSGTPSPKDIVMHWEGTCAQPGPHTLFITGPGGFALIEQVACGPDRTYKAANMVYDYESRGLKTGQRFTYSATLDSLNEPFTRTEFEGTATL
ncbi:hypothetical protein [Streptomyces sp. 1-11]|uniref:hypothetical protein n=1 Tax=Streptomyces sp. 1-11 TaxID=2590549 RepID=UPI00116EE289|nr:hypothetical protein [Streptomyces sp. 1-11]GEK04323.1 hypothetical protein TNCT1_65990 [Streptomyces sp. 1-11]